MPAKTDAAPDFETLLKDLTQVVEKLERGNLPLEESIALYARGTELLKAAQGVLDKAQARLEVLVASPDGSLKTESLDPAAFLDEKSR
jgi:exodeoxyribonuclease VII small subunit